MTNQGLGRNTFIRKFLSGLILHGIKTLYLKKRSVVYQAFYVAFKQTNDFTLRGYVRQVMLDYDPLYGYSKWLEHGLLESCRSLQMTFHDGLTFDIHLTTAEAETTLTTEEEKEAFTLLTSEFIKELKRLDPELRLTLTKEAREKLTDSA